MLCWSGSASGEPLSEATVDSLVWDIQNLERELVQCKLDGQAVADTLRHELRWAQFDLAAAEDREAKWYQSPAMWFLFGAAASVLVIGSTINLTF